MPVGDVSLSEFARAVSDRLEAQIPYLEGRVRFVDGDDETDPEVLRKGLGTSRFGVRIIYGEPAITNQRGFNSVMEFGLNLTLVVVVRQMGSLSQRTETVGQDRDITTITKDVMSALAGERLGLLNMNGIEVGSGNFGTDGSALQWIVFSVSGKSRETRS